MAMKYSIMCQEHIAMKETNNFLDKKVRGLTNEN